MKTLRQDKRSEMKRKMQSSFFGSPGRTILQLEVAILQPECPESQSSSKAYQCPIRYSMPTTNRASRRAAYAHGGRQEILNFRGQPAVLSCLDDG